MAKSLSVNRGDTQNFKEVTPERAKEGIATLLQPQTTTQQYAPVGSQPWLLLLEAACK